MSYILISFCVVLSWIVRVHALPAVLGKFGYPPDKISEVMDRASKQRAYVNEIHSSSIPNETIAVTEINSSSFQTTDEERCIELSVYDSQCGDETTDYYDCECDCEDDDHLKESRDEMPLDMSSQMKKSAITINGSPYGILFVWPFLSNESSSIGQGNEFEAAIKSIRQSNSDIPIYLATNAATVSLKLSAELTSYIHVVSIDLVNISSTDVTAQELFRHAMKPQALIQGWKNHFLPEYVLVLDVNVLVGSASGAVSLMSMFEPLKSYDIAGCFESFAADLSTGSIGWGMNTGVFVTKASAFELMSAWYHIMISRRDYYHTAGGQQQALMTALEMLPSFRIFPIPSTFNFKRSTLLATSMQDIVAPVIVNSHIYSDTRVDIESSGDVAKIVARSIVEDAFMDMSAVDVKTENACAKVNEIMNLT